MIMFSKCDYTFQCTKELKTNIENVDIFACIHFRKFIKTGNFACIKIHVLGATGFLGYNRGFFEGYIYSWIFKKCELGKNNYVHPKNIYVHSRPIFWILKIL